MATKNRRNRGNGWQRVLRDINNDVLRVWSTDGQDIRERSESHKASDRSHNSLTRRWRIKIFVVPSLSLALAMAVLVSTANDVQTRLDGTPGTQKREIRTGMTQIRSDSLFAAACKIKQGVIRRYHVQTSAQLSDSLSLR